MINKFFTTEWWATLLGKEKPPKPQRQHIKSDHTTDKHSYANDPRVMAIVHGYTRSRPNSTPNAKMVDALVISSLANSIFYQKKATAYQKRRAQKASKTTLYNDTARPAENVKTKSVILGAAAATITTAKDDKDTPSYDPNS